MSVLERTNLDQTERMSRPMGGKWVARAARDEPELPFGLPERSSAPAGRVVVLTVIVAAFVAIVALF